MKKHDERRRQEQPKTEEWIKRVLEEKMMEKEWKRGFEEDRKDYIQAVKKWAKKAAILNSEVSVLMHSVTKQEQLISG